MNKVSVIILGCFCLFLSACTSEYDSYVKRELNSGIKKDSLIFGMKIGQTKKDFFSICWELNKEQIISQGTGNQTAQYIEPLDTISPDPRRKRMLFYGIFDDDKVMQGMDMTYQYTAWAPWNRERYSDSLAIELRQQYTEDYKGNDFITIDIKDIEYDAFVKVDGNRQILIYPKNDKEVVVKIEDLNYKYNR